MINESVIGLGTFDGVHLGHRALINKVLEISQKNNILPAIHLFTNHPLSVLTTQEPSVLTTFDEKTELLKGMGIVTLVNEQFTSQFAAKTPTEFIKYIVKRANARYIVVGFNYSFGKGGEGTPELLAKLCNDMGIGLFIIPPVKAGDTIISSTTIRQTITEGRLENANALLGYEYFLTGLIGDGRKVGRNIGYPTANLIVNKQKVMPPNGVYITRILAESKSYNAITNIGYRPTFGDSLELSVETYVPGFLGDLYKRHVKLSFVKRIRPEIRFDNIDALKSQLSTDVMLATQYFEDEKSRAKLKR